MTSSLR
jgi:hypothetical protein